MPRSVRARVETRSARLALPARGAPYWYTLEPGLAAGYYHVRHGAGTWWGRKRDGGRYTVKTIGVADDYADADGHGILSWPQAQAVVRAWASRGNSTLTVAAVVDTYLEDLRARKGEKAARSAAGRLLKHLIPALGDRPVADLTDQDVRAWRNGMVPAGDEEQVRRARDTANRVLNIAKAAFNFAFNTGQVTDDRAWRRVGAFQGVGEARKIILSDLELQRLVAACEPSLRELVAVGAQTGARLGELTSARIRDFDAEAGTLKVRGKTGAREIHLAPGTVLILGRCAAGKRPDELLLPPADRATWARNLHARRFAVAVKRAGLDPATVFYSLRHSYISRALRQLVPVKAVADATGTSMAMIEAHYARFIVEDKRRYAIAAAVPLEVGDADDDRVVALRAVQS